jgi:hypothetical protein
MGLHTTRIMGFFGAERKEGGSGSTNAQEVRMWTNLIHLGLWFWSLL